jgi:hypothetical protein
MASDSMSGVSALVTSSLSRSSAGKRSAGTERRRGGKSCFLPTYCLRAISDCLRANVVSSEHV